MKRQYGGVNRLKPQFLGHPPLRVFRVADKPTALTLFVRLRRLSLSTIVLAT